MCLRYLNVFHVAGTHLAVPYTLEAQAMSVLHSAGLWKKRQVVRSVHTRIEDGAVMGAIVVVWYLVGSNHVDGALGIELVRYCLAFQDLFCQSTHPCNTLSMQASGGIL